MRHHMNVNQMRISRSVDQMQKEIVEIESTALFHIRVKKKISPYAKETDQLRIDHSKLSLGGSCRSFLSFYFRWGHTHWSSGLEAPGYTLYSVIKTATSVVLTLLSLNTNVTTVFAFLWFNTIAFVVLRKIENEINEDG